MVQFLKITVVAAKYLLPFSLQDWYEIGYLLRTECFLLQTMSYIKVERRAGKGECSQMPVKKTCN